MSVDKKHAELESALPSTGAVAENPLSEREMEVSRLLVTGASNSEIARVLVISPHTVKVHLRNVFEKLQVSSRTEASMVLLQRGWLTMPGVDVAPPAEPAPPTVPDPEPLADLEVQPGAWHQVVLLGALVLSVVVLFLPSWLSRPKSSIGLLSDSGQTVLGKPVVATSPRWEPRTPLAPPRSRLGAVMRDGMIYAIGGESIDGETLANVDTYDLRFNRWLPGPKLPKPLANVAATVAGGAIVVAGGSLGGNGAGNDEVTVADDLYVLPPDVDAWEHAGKLPVPLAGAALVTHADALYLTGGWDGSAMHAEIWQLPVAALGEVTAKDWTAVTRLNTPAAFLGAVIANGEIMVAGGYDGQRELADAASYHVEEGTWRRLPPMATPRSGHALVFDGVAVVALGGGWTRTVDTHERFDWSTNQWSNFASPIGGEWRHLAATIDEGTIHLLGGWSGDYLDIHLQYQSTFRALLPAIPRAGD